MPVPDRLLPSGDAVHLPPAGAPRGGPLRAVLPGALGLVQGGVGRSHQRVPGLQIWMLLFRQEVLRPAFQNLRIQTRFGGVRFPTHMLQKQDGFPSLDLTIASVTVNPPVDITVPDNVRTTQLP